MLTSLDLLVFFEPWVPVIDNIIIHGQLFETIQNISFPLKPLIIGTLTEETLSFVYTVWNKTISPTLYSEAILAVFKTKALEILERFPPSGAGDQKQTILVFLLNGYFLVQIVSLLVKLLLILMFLVIHLTIMVGEIKHIVMDMSVMVLKYHLCFNQLG